MRRFFIISSLFIFIQYGWSQPIVGNLLEEMPLDSVQNNGLRSHSSVKPAIRVATIKAENYVRINALTDLNYAQKVSGEYKAGGGIELRSVINDKWFARIAAVQGVSNFSGNMFPKAFLTVQDTSKSSYLYTDIRSRLSYTPNHIFNFQAGLDHNFIGEGSRSMFLSDYGKPYPFASIRTNFWRIEYTILYQFMHEKNGNKAEGKFMSSHHISFNASKSINFGLFETVIFQPKDTLLQRGFDAEYLNPLIFYRPQEYSLGSSDNVLLGVDATARWKGHVLYGQFIIDEFDLPQLRAKTGYWANKFGGQLGIKGRFGANKNWFYRLEYNFARPYTYSHVSEELAYGTQGTSLAHPYGANFMEILGELKYQRKKITVKLFSNYFMTGDNKDGYFYGANIYESYVNRPSDYGHFIGRGTQQNKSLVVLSGNYQLLNHGNMNVFTEFHLLNTAQTSNTTFMLVVGLRSVLWNDYRNY